MWPANAAHASDVWGDWWMIDWPTEDGRSYTRAAPATLSGAVHVVIHGPNIFDIAAMQKVSITKPVAQTTA